MKEIYEKLKRLTRSVEILKAKLMLMLNQNIIGISLAYIIYVDLRCNMFINIPRSANKSYLHNLAKKHPWVLM